MLLTPCEGHEDVLNVVTRFGTRRKVCAAYAPRIGLSLVIRDDFRLAHVRLVARDHDWDLSREILPKLRDPLVHLLEGIRISAIVDNHSA